jgi:hypothetical protein
MNVIHERRAELLYRCDNLMASLTLVGALLKLTGIMPAVPRVFIRTLPKNANCVSGVSIRPHLPSVAHTEIV